MINGEHVHITPPGAIGTKCILLQVLEVISLLRCTVKFGRSKGKFILAVFFAISVVARFHVRGLLVQSLRMTLRPIVSDLCSLEHTICKFRIKLRVNAGGLCHHRCKVQRRCQALFNNITQSPVNFGHRAGTELERREFMINATVLVLHRKHPIEIPADFFKQFRHLRELARNIPLERIHVRREMFIEF